MRAVSTPWQGATRRIGYSTWEGTVLIHTACPDITMVIGWLGLGLPQ